MGSAFQIDKKIVRTEIGVLLRLSHPNIVSTAPRHGSLPMGVPALGAKGRVAMSLNPPPHNPVPRSPPCPTAPCSVPISSFPFEF